MEFEQPMPNTVILHTIFFKSNMSHTFLFSFFFYSKSDIRDDPARPGHDYEEDRVCFLMGFLFILKKLFIIF